MSRVAIATLLAVGCRGSSQPAGAEWVALPLAQIPGASFRNPGALSVPPGTTARGQGQTATLTLPDGKHAVLLEEDDPSWAPPVHAPADLSPSAMLQQGSTWYVVEIPRGGRFMVSGSSWGTLPAIRCGGRETIDRATSETVVRICASLAPSP
jgi:hypothetical protein